MRIVGHGHVEIRASHDKTWEITPDDMITGRATCVIAVGGQVVGPRPVAGRVRLTLDVDGPEGPAGATVHALGNPGWDPSGTAVVRRGPLRLPGTLATCADRAAADLPREVVAALRHPVARVRIDVTPEAAERPCVVLCAVDAVSPDLRLLRAELAAAGRVVAEDAAARRLVAGIHGDSGSDNDSGDGALADPARTLVVATETLPGARSAELFGDPHADLDVVGLPPALAVAAALGPAAPVAFAARPSARAALRAARPDHHLVLRTTRAELTELVVLAAQLRPDAAVLVAQQFAPPVRVRPGEIPELAGADAVHLAVGAAQATTAVEPAARDALVQLLADGVATRAVARAAATLTGVSRRDAYELVLRWRESAV